MAATHMEKKVRAGRMVSTLMCGLCALAAVTAQARVEYAWSEPFALTEAITNEPTAQAGDQHTLFFTNGMVRVHHRVTDEWFDLQPTPFASVVMLPTSLLP